MTARLTRQTEVDEGEIGLYRAVDFRLTDGRCGDCDAIPQALWYFRDQTIAVPRAGFPVAGFARGATAFDDVARWAAGHAPGTPADYPALIWAGSSAVVRGARLDAAGTQVSIDGTTMAFDIVPKIPLNRSYYNAASIAYLSGRTLKMRGEIGEGRFTARSIWPEDFRLDVDGAALSPPAATDASPEAVRRLLRSEPRGGATSDFAAIGLWERTPGAARRGGGKPVLAVMLNGAQGDDDEAHGGHFAIVTGRVGTDGAIDDWMANNFYTLDLFSEKGIIASALPLDRYLADLNSGQSWYRPSHLMVAVLNNDRTASHVQGALNRVYNQFYRHQLVYGNVTMNCAGISIDALRALGWNLDARKPAGRVLAWLAVPWVALRERSITRARQAFDYLSEDGTRMFPAAAFEETAADLLRLSARSAPRELTRFETMLADDIEALVWLRVPQLPSSRAWGDFAVVNGREYAARLPADRSQAKIIPVPPRPFPPELRDSDLLPPPPSRSAFAVVFWAVLSLAGIPWLLWRWRQSQARGESLLT
ncbi:MAG TPA: hypothetical protein VHZ01_09695 [Casimicrobiaceae bacterium]|nr:hypothetical protein [Casimicrobiaceae bacterium]